MMWILRFTLLLFVFPIGMWHFTTPNPLHAQSNSIDIDEWMTSQQASILETYQWFHSHPEVSFEEVETADRLSMHLSKAGFHVTRGIGGHGVVGVLNQGEGKNLMLRCDLDALPVRESTPLPFASTKTIQLPGGGTAGVMHACGHDVHITNLITTATFLASHKNLWSGTLVVIGQPAEERGAGASAMLKDGLFEKFPRPDYALALHVSGDTAAGTIKLRPGYAMANVDSVDITVKGRGGHGSQPHTTIDPIAQAATLVLDLQSIVSREIKPTEPAVVTIGAIHGGTKHNIIGNDCHLQITVRSYSPQVREQLLAAIQRKAKAVATSYRAPEPTIKISEGTPSLRNDPELTSRLRKVFESEIGSEQVQDAEPTMGGEDFSQYGIAGVPILMYRLGSVSQRRLDRYQKLDVPPPSLHSAEYYPDFDLTIRTGVKTMVAASLHLLTPLK